jgi:hypothetical protein
MDSFGNMKKWNDNAAFWILVGQKRPNCVKLILKFGLDILKHCILTLFLHTLGKTF